MAESHYLPGGSRCGELAQQQEKDRDWSELPPEMLHLISKKLPDLPDFVRFRAVCHRWRSDVSLSDPPPQLPWFVRERWDHLDYSDPQNKVSGTGLGLGVIEGNFDLFNYLSEGEGELGSKVSKAVKGIKGNEALLLGPDNQIPTLTIGVKSHCGVGLGELEIEGMPREMTGEEGNACSSEAVTTAQNEG